MSFLRKGTAVTRALAAAMAEQLKLGEVDPCATTDTQCHAITQQINAALEAAGRGSLIQTFNGNCGPNRGIASGLLVVLAVAPAVPPLNGLVPCGVLVAIGLAASRMHRFGTHCGRELFVLFLQLPARERPPENKA